jgi:hypothetical protein
LLIAAPRTLLLCLPLCAASASLGRSCLVDSLNINKLQLALTSH